MTSISAPALAAILAVTSIGLTAQVVGKPNTPNPADRGGEFTITGCVQQETGRAGAPPAYKITRVSAATGEGRAVGAMGTGVAVAGANSSATPRSNPPDIVPSEYRLVATEQADLPKYVNQTVEARGALQDMPASAGGSTGGVPATGNAATGSDAKATTGAGNRVFVATAVKKLADTCTEVRGN